MDQNINIDLIKIYQTGDDDAQKMASSKLWHQHQHWIGKLVGKYAKKSTMANVKEMMSEACLAFLKATKAYDQDNCRQCSLKTFASYWIRGALNSHVQVEKHNNFVVPRCPAKLRDTILELTSNRNSLGSVQVKSLALGYDFSDKQIRSFELFFTQSSKSSFDSWEEQGGSSSENFETLDDNKLRLEIRQFVIEQAIPIAHVLSSRWLVDKKLTYSSLANEMTHSKEQIRRIELEAFTRLRKRLVSKAMVFGTSGH